MLISIMFIFWLLFKDYKFLLYKSIKIIFTLYNRLKLIIIVILYNNIHFIVIINIILPFKKGYFYITNLALSIINPCQHTCATFSPFIFIS